MAIKLQGTNSVAAPGLTNDGGDGVVVGTDSVEISTGGTSRVKVDSDGRVLTGGQTTSVADASSLHSDIQSHSADGNGLSIGRYSANAYEPYMTFFKSRNTTIGSNASAVTDNDWLGNTNYYGATGSAWKHAAYQAVLIDGSVGGADDSMPAEFQWHNRDATALNHNMSIRASGDLEVKRGNVVIGTAGKGIDFSAQTWTSAAGGNTTHEVLDHYEEGTWTPADQTGNGLSISVVNATYVRVGDLVFVEMYVTAPTTTVATHCGIQGLPFNVKGSNHYSYLSGRIQTLGASNITAQVNANTDDIFLYHADNALGWDNVSGCYILLSGCYQTS